MLLSTSLRCPFGDRTKDQLARSEPPTGEPEATIYIRLPRPLKERIEAAAKGEGVSLNAWVMRCVERCTAPQAVA